MCEKRRLSRDCAIVYIGPLLYSFSISVLSVYAVSGKRKGRKGFFGDSLTRKKYKLSAVMGSKRTVARAFSTDKICGSIYLFKHIRNADKNFYYIGLGTF